MKTYKKPTCIVCRLSPQKQGESRPDAPELRCRPGLCVVKGAMWLVFSDGTPLEWTPNKTEMKIIANYNEYINDNDNRN